MRKREIVMLFCIGICWFVVFALLGRLAGDMRPNWVEKAEEKEGTDVRKEEEAKEDEWNLLLVNREYPLSQNYKVPAFTELKNGHVVDSRIYPELQRMMDAARAEGLEPLICSSYRTWDRQQELYIQKVRSYVSAGQSWENALELAAGWVQKPGCSEHQTGMALDIVDTTYQLLDSSQADTPVQRWLMSHCHEYGFILRYPKEKERITGVNYEPWHYRYVGKEAAKEIMETGICLEEYLGKENK